MDTAWFSFARGRRSAVQIPWTVPWQLLQPWKMLHALAVDHARRGARHAQIECLHRTSRLCNHHVPSQYDIFLSDPLVAVLLLAVSLPPLSCCYRWWSLFSVLYRFWRYYSVAFLVFRNAQRETNFPSSHNIREKSWYLVVTNA